MLCITYMKSLVHMNDERILNNCFYYMNTLPLNFEYLIIKFRFLLKMRQAEIEHKSIILWCKIDEVKGSAELLRDLQLQPTSGVALSRKISG